MATASCGRWATRAGSLSADEAPWERSSYARINYFQDNIAHGRENEWRCRAGARYLYICEDGWCTTARSSAAIRPSRLRNTPSTIFAANSHGKELRAALHRGLRALHVVHGFLARAADHPRR